MFGLRNPPTLRKQLGALLFLCVGMRARGGFACRVGMGEQNLAWGLWLGFGALPWELRIGDVRHRGKSGPGGRLEDTVYRRPSTMQTPFFLQNKRPPYEV
jgi:hypothetical protein